MREQKATIAVMKFIWLNHSVLWLIKRCDLWQEGSTDKYMDGCMDKWKAAEVSREEFAVLTKGLACLNGDDLSKRIDLTGQAFLFKLHDGRYALKACGFIP